MPDPRSHRFSSAAQPLCAPVLLALAALVALSVAACDEGGEMTILDMNPRTSPLQGEQPVSISGRNFRTDIGYTVYFGSKRATSVTILSTDELRVTTPSTNEEGPVDVTITADNGPAFRIAGQFTYRSQAPAGAGAGKKGSLEF